MSDRQDRPHSIPKSHRASNTTRGQVNPQFIIGAFILIIIAGSLIAAAIDIQTSLANTPAFSGFSAAVVAMLLVAAIVAAVLGE